MKVAFVHYHLRPGGVSRVILDQMESLRGKAQALAVIGESPSSGFPFPCAVVPSIAYDRDRMERVPSPAIASSIIRAVREIWSEGADLYHFHNPTLGKNRDLLGAVKRLQAMGVKALLQIHDFAEDGRPEGYFSEEYPADCHYAVINRRDYRILLASGLKEEGLHHLPDSIRPLRPAGPEGAEKKLILYPVRAIRRKNLGEAVLLSLFLPEGQSLGVTLEPTGSLDRRSYLEWRDLVGSERLRVLFRLGIERSFESVLRETRCMITTSVKEGFGLAYLEPWTARKMLYGRTLPEVCSDFVEKGLRLDHLYAGIRVPLDFIDLGGFQRKWQRCYESRLARYGLTDSPVDGEGPFQKLIREGNVDFGMLSEDLQKQALVKVMRDPTARSVLAEMNPFLEGMFSGGDPEGLIEENRLTVQREYSLKKSADRLLRTYGAVLSGEVRQSIDKRALARAFNTPEQNHLLLCAAAYD
jgi:hypothetical protein